MFNTSDLIWLDFETTGALSLKAVGTPRYVAEASTRATILAYAIGDAPARSWHANGAILDWDNAPEDLCAAFARGAIIAAWNASFDAATWNYATLGFPFLVPERVIDPMIQAGVSNLPTDLEQASRALGGAGKQSDGKKLVRLFSIEGAAPGEYPAEWQRFCAYARQDVEAMRDVYRRTRPLPREEWQQYWAFERINQRGVAVDLPFVRRAAALAAEDGVAIGRRLCELTDGAVTRVTQAQRIATWLYDRLADAAMREVLTVGVPADDDNDNHDDGDEARDADTAGLGHRPAAAIRREHLPVLHEIEGGIDEAITRTKETSMSDRSASAEQCHAQNPENFCEPELFDPDAIRLADIIFDSIITTLRRDLRFAGIPLLEWECLFADMRGEIERKLNDEFTARTFASALKVMLTPYQKVGKDSDG